MISGLTAGVWNPMLHPRGKDGKFIEKYGWVSWIAQGKEFLGQVTKIDPKTGAVTVRRHDTGKTTTIKSPSTTLSQATPPKPSTPTPAAVARASVPAKKSALPVLKYEPMIKVSRQVAEQRLAERAEKFGDASGETYKIPPAWGDEIMLFHNLLDPKAGMIARSANPNVRGAIYSKAHERTAAAQKFARLQRIQKALPQFEARVIHDALDGDDSALVALMLYRTGMRVASTSLKNPKSKAPGTVFGATTLQARHVTFIGEGTPKERVRISFIGKMKAPNTYETDDPVLIDLLRSRKSASSSPYEPMFPGVAADHVRDYLKRSLDVPDAKNHDLRTHRANVLALAAINAINLRKQFQDPKKNKGRPRTPKQFKDRRIEVAKIVAEALNDTWSPVLAAYINPALFEEWRVEADAPADLQARIADTVLPQAVAAAAAAGGNAVPDGYDNTEPDDDLREILEQAKTVEGFRRLSRDLAEFLDENEDFASPTIAPAGTDDGDDTDEMPEALLAAWNPLLHPRGRDGRFIEKFGWVSWLEAGARVVGRVQNIDGTTGEVTLQRTDGKTVIRPPSVLSRADAPSFSARMKMYPGAGTPQNPYRVDGDIDMAAYMLQQGKSVRLEQVMEVSTLLDRLAEIAEDAAARGKTAPDYDLCLVSIPGTNLFCAEHIGIHRHEMPQFRGKNAQGEKINIEDEWRAMLESTGIPLTPTQVPASHLRASQAELIGTKVAEMIAKMRDGRYVEAPMFVSRDGYILDGHHRWAAKVAIDAEDGKLGDVLLDVEIIDLEIGEVIDLARDFGMLQGIQPSPGMAATQNPAQPLL